MTMVSRLIMMKLLMLHHVANLPNGTLARDCYDGMVSKNLPVGLSAECAPFLTEFGITDIRNVSKHHFKRIIKRKIKEHDKKHILE